MIFVTVGAQMPFDRLIRAVDAWATSHPEHRVYAQINEASYRPSHLHWTDRLDAAAFRRCMYEADLVVTHAGMGTILTSLELGKPTIVMPRRGHLRETRNDHQVSTAEAITADDRVAVAWDEHELKQQLDRLAQVAPPPPVPTHASAELLEALKQFIRDGSTQPARAPQVDTNDRGDVPAPIVNRDPGPGPLGPGAFLPRRRFAA